MCSFLETVMYIISNYSYTAHTSCTELIFTCFGSTCQQTGTKRVILHALVKQQTGEKIFLRSRVLGNLQDADTGAALRDRVYVWTYVVIIYEDVLWQWRSSHREALWQYSGYKWMFVWTSLCKFHVFSLTLDKSPLKKTKQIVVNLRHGCLTVIILLVSSRQWQWPWQSGDAGTPSGYKLSLR